MSAGLDSISGTEFTNTLAQQFEVELTPTLLFDYPTIESMTGFIVESMPSTMQFEASSERSKSVIELRPAVVSRPFPMASRPSCVLLNVEHSALKAGEQGAKYQLQTRDLKPAGPGASESFFCYYM